MRTQLATVSGLPSYIAWENRPFKLPDPKDNPLWIRERMYIYDERRSATGIIEATGETRYDVFVKAGGGTEAAEALAKSIAETFEAAESIEGSAFSIVLERTERKNLFHETEFENWSFYPVSIKWRVYVGTTAG